MSPVTAGRPTEVSNAAAATLADLDRELRAVETERQRAAAVAWLDESFAHALTLRLPAGYRTLTPAQRKLADEHSRYVSRASNYSRPIADVLPMPGVGGFDRQGRNVFDEYPDDDAARWPDPMPSREVSEADDFRDGMTPSERRNRAGEEARAAAAERARVRHVDILGPPRPLPSVADLTGRRVDLTIIDDPVRFEARRSDHLEWSTRPDLVAARPRSVLEQLRDGLASGDLSDRVAIEIRDDQATNTRRTRLTLDGETWHDLTWAEGNVAYTLLQQAAQRRNAIRFAPPPPAPPPARFRWNVDLERAANPDLFDGGRRLTDWVSRIAERADVDEAVTELAALLGPTLRSFEREHLRRQFAMLERRDRRRVLHVILERFVHPGRPVDWSTIVEDVLHDRPHRPGRPVPEDESFGQYQDRTAAQDRIRELMRNWPDRIRREHENCRCQTEPIHMTDEEIRP